MKGLPLDKKLEIHVGADLQGNYLKDEVDELIQIAFLGTQMLEDNRLVEMCDEWQKDDISRQEFSQIIDDLMVFYLTLYRKNDSEHV